MRACHARTHVRTHPHLHRHTCTHPHWHTLSHTGEREREYIIPFYICCFQSAPQIASGACANSSTQPATSSLPVPTIVFQPVTAQQLVAFPQPVTAQRLVVSSQLVTSQQLVASPQPVAAQRPASDESNHVCDLDLSGPDLELWRLVGLERGLSSDAKVAVFLLSL